jgi:phospholipid-translocating ATPase
LRHGNFKRIKCKDIKCGDLVRVKVNEQFPCDMVLLYSNSNDKACHVTTVNLDGETNLKAKRVINTLTKTNVRDLNNLNGVIVCDKPNSNLNEFKGKLIINDISQ